MVRNNEQRYRITGDIDPRSFWLATTPSVVQLEMPFVCTEAGALYGREHFVTGRLSKDSYLLIYTFGGAGYFTQANRTVTVNHGQALLMDCRMPQVYGTSATRGHWYHLWAHIEGAGVEAMARRLGVPKLMPITLSETRMRSHFELLFDKIKTESVENEERMGISVHTMLSELVMAVARTTDAPDDPVRLACVYAVDHLADPISVEDLAKAANVSSSYLTRLFRQSLGTSPHDYLLRQRISRAQQLLIETDEPIGSVARQVGFATESNVSYRFAKMCDITPSAYRKLRYGTA